MKPMYMHVATGGIDYAPSWIDAITPEELEEYGDFDYELADELFDRYVADGVFVEVVRDENGNWIEKE